MDEKEVGYRENSKQFTFLDFSDYQDSQSKIQIHHFFKEVIYSSKEVFWTHDQRFQARSSGKIWNLGVIPKTSSGFSAGCE